MRVIGPDSDKWLMLLPAWYECWPTRLANFFNARSKNS
jgi:hypothetical protein